MMVGIELLIVCILLSLFSSDTLFCTIYLLLSLIGAVCYYFCFKKEYKKLEKEEKEKLKSQISYKLIIISFMIITINLVYPLGNINLILGYLVLVYFAISFVYRLCKNTMLSHKHLMNFNHLFDVYSIACLCMIFWDVISYAI